MRVLVILLAVFLIGCSQNVVKEQAASEQIEVIGMALNLTTPEFEQNRAIPKKFTCEGEDVNPELNIKGVPKATKSLVLIMDDPDAPPKVWEHWTVINILPQTKIIPENSIPGKELTNDFRRVAWGGPCPPPGKVHNYNFKLYALDILLDLDSSATKLDVKQAMSNHIIEETVLIGTYER